MAALTSSQEQQLRDAFNLFDTNRSGNISKSELKKVLKVFGIKANDTDLQVLVDRMDADKNGKIDFNEFKAIMTRGYFRRHSKEEIELAFSNYDTDGNGYLTVDELQKVMCNTGRVMTLTEVKSMVQTLDKNKDGKISLTEFMKLFE